MRVAVIAPINKSLYSLVLCELLRREPGVELAGVLLRRAFSWSRIRQELRRDGPRLLRKVWRKLIVGESHVARSRLRISVTTSAIAAKPSLDRELRAERQAADNDASGSDRGRRSRQNLTRADDLPTDSVHYFG